jgi:hypothetical protein
MGEFEVNYDEEGQHENDLDLNSPDPAPEPEPLPDAPPAIDVTPDQQKLIDEVLAIKQGEKLSKRFNNSSSEAKDIMVLFAANNLPSPEVFTAKYHTYLIWQK